MDAETTKTMAQAFTDAVSQKGMFDGLMDCVVVAFSVSLPVMIGGWGLRKGASALSGFLHRV